MKILPLNNFSMYRASLKFQNLSYEVNLTVGNFNFWLKNIFSVWTFTIWSQMLWGILSTQLLTGRITVGFISRLCFSHELFWTLKSCEHIAPLVETSERLNWSIKLLKELLAQAFKSSYHFMGMKVQSGNQEKKVSPAALKTDQSANPLTWQRSPASL